jgi:hypothetical protein
MGGSLVFGLGGFIIYLVLTPFVIRAINRAAPALIVVLCAMLIYAVLLFVGAITFAPLYFWIFSATYWFFSLCFLMVFGAIYKSVSLRLLLDLLNRPGHADSYQAVLDRYVRQESYQDRLQIMVKEGFAVRDLQKFVLAPKGRLIAAVVINLQKAFRIEKSG